MTLPDTNFQTKMRGNDHAEYELFLELADDGDGGDITNFGKPLPSFEEWLCR